MAAIPPPGTWPPAAYFPCQLRRYLPYTSCAPLPASLSLSTRSRSSKRSSTRNDDRPAEMRSNASGVTTSVTLANRSEEHTSELQSLRHLVCRLLLEKKKHTMHCQSGH